ncbi:glycerophosphodiester phosphodiesterase family protein [Oleispirillum naphthae]|uniref:glycerophosphodiester phosphodiesterase family protein n=1 Tax=Oleispirillum naphthae TaxID=2838853 RepID=UPI0030826A89
MPAGRVIGHRGAVRLAPENTLAAFRAAARVGARWVETDVSLLGDGTPVICHDADLGRIAGRRERLADLAAEDLALLGVAEKVPTLAAALEALDDFGLSVNLDVKARGDAEDLAAALVLELTRRPWPRERLLVSSFDAEVLAVLAAARPDIRLGILCEEIPDDWALQAARVRAVALHPYRRALSPAFAVEMLAAGLEIYAWTVNDPAEAMRLWGWGVTGVITDDPALLLGLAGASA